MEPWLNPDLGREIAAPPPAWTPRMRNPNRVLIEEVGGRWGGYADLLNESQVHACLQVRKLAVTGRPWGVRRSDGAADATARRIEDLLAPLDLPGVIGSLMEALVLGFQVAEVIWSHREGRWIPTGIKVRPNDRFGFDGAGRLHRLDPARGAAEPIEERHKFLVATWGPRDGNRYGRGLGEMLYYLAWFKRENLKFWLIFNDKHAYPTPLAILPEGATEEEMARIRDRLARLRDESVLVTRQGTDIRLLEADRAGAVETFRDLIEFCNHEIAKILLGQTLTTDAPSAAGSGSYALGRVHNAVRADIADADAVWIGAIVDRLIEWIAEVSLGAPPGRWRWTADRPAPPA